MGSVFWWQVLAPREEQRLSPPAGIVYLFTACTACSVLGIILTFARFRFARFINTRSIDWESSARFAATGA